MKTAGSILAVVVLLFALSLVDLSVSRAQGPDVNATLSAAQANATAAAWATQQVAQKTRDANAAEIARQQQTAIAQQNELRALAISQTQTAVAQTAIAQARSATATAQAQATATAQANATATAQAQATATAQANATAIAHANETATANAKTATAQANATATAQAQARGTATANAEATATRTAEIVAQNQREREQIITWTMVAVALAVASAVVALLISMAIRQSNSIAAPVAPKPIFIIEPEAGSSRAQTKTADPAQPETIIEVGEYLYVPNPFGPESVPESIGATALATSEQWHYAPNANVWIASNDLVNEVLEHIQHDATTNDSAPS